MEEFDLSTISTSPDEQSQVFMILEEPVSKSVVSSIAITYNTLNFCCINNIATQESTERKRADYDLCTKELPQYSRVNQMFRIL